VANPRKSGSLTIGGIATTTAQFVIDPNKTTCTVGARLSKRGRCRIVVEFQPSSVGTQLDLLTIQSDAINQPRTVRLQGKGIP